MTRYRIETYVGPKYGMWKAGERVYDTQASAEHAVMAHRNAERYADATRMKRRVITA